MPTKLYTRRKARKKRKPDMLAWRRWCLLLPFLRCFPFPDSPRSSEFPREQPWDEPPHPCGENQKHLVRDLIWGEFLLLKRLLEGPLDHCTENHPAHRRDDSSQTYTRGGFQSPCLFEPPQKHMRDFPLDELRHEQFHLRVKGPTKTLNLTE